MINYTTYTNNTSTEWITFIHGAGGSSSIWFKQVREFKKHCNLLLVDLRGHGGSKTKKSSYTFDSIANDVLEVLNHLKIKKSHFVGISLGTILIRQIAENHPQRISSMIMGGAILKMNFKSQILMKVGNLFKNILPYLMLYRLFAYIIMPKKRHKESRSLFIREAKKLYQREFIRWFKLTAEINPVLRWFRQVEINIPTFYIMGDEDHMFLPSIKEVVKRHTQNSSLKVIKECGHVVNLDQPNEFNKLAIDFIKKNSTTASI